MRNLAQQSCSLESVEQRRAQHLLYATVMPSSALLHSCPHITSSRSLRKAAAHQQRRESFRQIVTQAAAQGSTFGQLFRVTTYGTSHGLGVGCIVDGCPPRLPITVEEIQGDLDRRRPGQSRITTPRKESDTCQIVSGVSETGWTEGDPIHITVPNATQRSQDYKEMEVAYRPSHADATYDMKYGTRAVAGGGRASARETIGRVAAGAIAKKLLKQVCGTEVPVMHGDAMTTGQSDSMLTSLLLLNRYSATSAESKMWSQM